MKALAALVCLTAITAWGPRFAGAQPGRPSMPYWLPPPDPGRCVDDACRLVGPLGCQDPDRVLEVAQLCSTQNSGDCLAEACRQLGPLACDTVEELRPLADACRPNGSGGCLAEACSW